MKKLYKYIIVDVVRDNIMRTIKKSLNSCTAIRELVTTFNLMVVVCFQLMNGCSLKKKVKLMFHYISCWMMETKLIEKSFVQQIDMELSKERSYFNYEIKHIMFRSICTNAPDDINHSFDIIIKIYMLNYIML